MVVVNFSNVGQLVGEGTYPVTLTKASEKRTAKGADMVTLQATIRDSDTEWDGRPVFRNFVFGNEPDSDNSGSLYYLQQALLAFGADEEDVSKDKVDPVKLAASLYGNRAKATVTHNIDANNPEKKYANVQFLPDDF